MKPSVEGLPEPDMSVHAIGLGRNPQGLDGRRRNQLALLRRFGLQPTSNLLEIGCGIGWLAFDLASFLDETGSYTGFDISPDAIGWLNEHLAPRLATSASTSSTPGTPATAPTAPTGPTRCRSRTGTASSTWCARSACSCTSTATASSTT